MLNTATAIAAIRLLLDNAPAIITTGEEIFAFVSKGIAMLSDAIGSKDATPEQLKALVLAIVAMHNAIAAIP